MLAVPYFGSGLGTTAQNKLEGTSSCKADSRTRRAYSVRTIGDLPPTRPGIPWLDRLFSVSKRKSAQSAHRWGEFGQDIKKRLIQFIWSSLSSSCLSVCIGVAPRLSDFPEHAIPIRNQYPYKTSKFDSSCWGPALQQQGKMQPFPLLHNPWLNLHLCLKARGILSQQYQSLTIYPASRVQLPTIPDPCFKLTSPSGFTY